MSFETARANMEAGLAAKASGGTGAPASSDSGSPASSGTREADTSSLAPDTQQDFGLEGAAPEGELTPTEIMELDKLQKFKFEGEELTPAELKKRILRQSDYTKKMQAFSDEKRSFAQQAKYSNAVDNDLLTLVENPWRVEEFCQIYPERYHRLARAIVARAEATRDDTQAQPTQSTSEDPAQSARQFQQDNPNMRRLSQVEAKLADWEEKFDAQERELYIANLDKLENDLKSKFPEANQYEVYAAAEALADKEVAMNPQRWTQLYKKSHERNLAKFEERYAKRVKEQQTTSQKLAGTASGGGTPGQAPVVPRTMKEAREAAIKHFSKS